MENQADNSLIDRLKIFITFTGLSNSQFADRAGIPRPTLSQLIHGRNKSINDLLLRKLHDGFPSLNITWLLFGLGNMQEDSNIEFSKAQNEYFSESDDSEHADIDDTGSLFSQQILDSKKSESRNIHDTKGVADSLSPFHTLLKDTPPHTSSRTADNEKKIKSIIVFYTDSSFEVFTPDAVKD